MTHRCFVIAAAWVLSGTLAWAQPGPFTQSQVTAGRTAYQTNCAGCHGSDLAGAGPVPALTGPRFHATWASAGTGELWQFIASSMPFGNAGGLSDETYTNVVAFLLAANGARSGPKPFVRGKGGRIGAIADGRPVAAVIRP